MADSIDIQIGDQVIRVPRWATEETAIEMSKLNLASAKALTELVRQTGKGNKSVIENQKIFKNLSEATQRDTKEAEVTEKKLSKVKKEHGKVIENTTQRLKNAGNTITEVFKKDSLAGVTAAIAGVVGLGAIAGFTVGILENFAKNISELSNVGVGLGVSLVDLRQQAAQTGLSMEDYSKLVLTNGDALRAIGDNAQDGARQFSIVSEQARHLARDFNNFGMTNQEFNDVLLQEIELRRKAGFEQTALTQGVSGAMKNLMLETTAMAAMTGQDRRDMVRRRQEMMQDPSMLAARMAAAREGQDLADNFAAISDAFGAGGEVGSQIGSAILTAVMQDRDFRGVKGGGLAAVGNLNEEISAALTDIQEFVRSNRESMDPSEFRSQLITMLAQVPDVIDSEALMHLSVLADTGAAGAAELISFVSELEGLSKDLQENRDIRKLTEQQLVETALLALPSTLNEVSNQIKSSTLTTVLNGLGVDVNTSGEVLINALRGIADNFGTHQTLGDGLIATYEDLTTSMAVLKTAAYAAAIGIGLLSLPFVARRAIGATGAALSAAGRGLFGRGAATATTAAATGAATGAAASRGPSLLARTLSALGAAGRFALRTSPITAGAAVALTPSRLGDGTRTGRFDAENPPPIDGTPQQMLEWQRRRNESLDNITIQTQQEADNAYRETTQNNRPLFTNMDHIEQSRINSELPGTIGTLSNMRSHGGLDQETYEILTGRSFERMEQYMARIAESAALMAAEQARTRRVIEDGQ